ncbi:MAG TPA: 50S ribosomal protein L23 [Actinomycetota bacterium]
MKDPRDVVLAPVVSEKSYGALDRGVYTFIVHPDATKVEIRQAIETIFEVRVINVNTMWRKGKKKRTGWVHGARASRKRAVVTLAEGDSIEIFQAG